ncbi:FAD-dependent monooxygenase [Pseudonocardia yunnanensis]|uniref:FAD-dependent monooxygenase n=1 Tax=Pseudonocardia yunnanensis TaxID=58107 RepID=A0ABW4F5T5_9PSEU
MDTQVLIAGAGPTGLTLAIELARRGVGVRVLERAATAAVGSRGDGLQPRTLEVFDDLGVLDAVLAAGSPQASMRAYAGGRFLGERRMSDRQEPTPDVPHPNPWMLGQDRTEAILRDRLAGLGVRVELATELVTFTQDESGVTATLRRHGAQETARAGYLVGADGGASTVRRTLGIPFEGSTDESIRMLLGDVRADGLDHDSGYWFAAEDDMRRGVALTPLPSGDFFQFACPLDASDTEPSLATLQAVLDRYCPGSAPQLREPAWTTVWRPNVRLARRFRDGRVFLAGDAAHAHPPTGGQGLNTGVQDAYNLGWKLAAALTGPEAEAVALLDSYEAERLPVAARVLGISTALLRKHVAGDADAHRRGAETHQFDVGYRDSPLSRDTRTATGRLRAGDRAPDAPVVDADGRAIRLFDLFRGPHATVLAFGRTATDTTVAEPGVPVHPVLRPGEHATGPAVVDAEGHAFSAYDVADGTAVLVRPDGYVGSITRSLVSSPSGA